MDYVSLILKVICHERNKCVLDYRPMEDISNTQYLASMQ